MECVTLLETFFRNEALSYYVRLMCSEDIAQVTEIDCEAFPTQWPLTNYEHELHNRLAHYIVACDEKKTVDEPEMKALPEKGFSGLVSRVRRLFNHDQLFGDTLPSSGRQYITGFAGFWLVAEEAHIINIAVRKKYQRHGIGELLLISLIDLAAELKARIITLEVRVSNTTAQGLYYKYGFTQTGLRHSYYTDNREDGVLMSTENITSAPFQTHLNELKQAHSRKWGVALYRIAR